MSAPRIGAIALHVETAKRLLDELELHAEVALQSLGGVDDGAEFLAAVNARDRILSELNVVVEALAQERIEHQGDAAQSAEATTLLAEMARRASAALESHEHLLSRTQEERDRLAAALDRNSRPDNVAHQYAAATVSPRAQTLSVTG